MTLIMAEHWLKANGFQEGPMFSPHWREWTSPKGMRIQWVPFQDPPWSANIGDSWVARYGMDPLAGVGDSPAEAAQGCLDHILQRHQQEVASLNRYLDFVQENTPVLSKMEAPGTIPDPSP